MSWVKVNLDLFISESISMCISFYMEPHSFTYRALHVISKKETLKRFYIHEGQA